jgi:hypothetical protein
MNPPLFAAASALFLAGAYLSFGELGRQRAARLRGGAAGELEVDSTLGRFGDPSRVSGLYVRSKPGRDALIDHVLLGTRRLVVVETKNWNGTISGGPKETTWKQVTATGETRTLRNPILQAKRQAKVLSEASGVPVASLVVMAGRSIPANGTFPDGVVFVHSLQAALSPLLHGDHKSGDAAAADLSLAWNVLQASAGASGGTGTAARVADERNARFGRREWIGWVSMTIAVGALAIMTANP